VAGWCGGHRLPVAVPAAPGRKGGSEPQLKLEWEDVSIALTVMGAAVEIVNSTRSARLRPTDLDKRTLEGEKGLGESLWRRIRCGGGKLSDDGARRFLKCGGGMGWGSGLGAATQQEQGGGSGMAVVEEKGPGRRQDPDAVPPGQAARARDKGRLPMGRARERRRVGPGREKKTGPASE
jgi:hypothetical protein